MARSNRDIFIGTSNIVVPGNKTTFPVSFQKGSRLNYYASLFNSVEINSSFYKLPLPATFNRWSNDVPDDFNFSFKLSKSITHAKELKFDKKDIHAFLDAAIHAQKRLGPILIQFPGKITFDFYSEVEQLLNIIRAHDYSELWNLALEFRHKSWYVSETMELLDEFNAVVVMHDIPKSKNSATNKNAPFIYLRFHGTNGDYRGSYTDKEIAAYANQILEWDNKGKTVYAYFNNTMGNAYENAKTLQKLCGQNYLS